MGVYLSLSISKAVTRDEWLPVYLETLDLVNAFRLAEKRTVSIDGIEVPCLVPTVERSFTYGWRNELEKTGWEAHGDLDSLKTAEWFFLDRDLADESVDPTAGDPIMSALRPPGLDADESWNDKAHQLWDMKTQGEPYHMYLLAIGCLIQDRLDGKAYISGDITSGQCKEAVRLANEHLNKPIRIPDQCDMERFLKRVAALPLSEPEQLNAFMGGYLGRMDATLGNFIRSSFAQESIAGYWIEQLGYYRIGTYGYREAFRLLLELGFSLDSLVDFTNFEDDDRQYLDFIAEVMDAKLHLQDKDCTDVLAIDPDNAGRYGVASQFAKIIFGVFGGLGNKHVNRYIPLETIRATLKRTIGDKVNVDEAIDERLAKDDENAQQLSSCDPNGNEAGVNREQASEAFNNLIANEANRRREMNEQYDISNCEDFLRYKPADSIEPQLAASLAKFTAFYNGVLEEERYQELLKTSATECCEFLAYQNKYILLSDSDWKMIFRDIHADITHFARYYPAVRVEASNEYTRYIVSAIVLNDEFYKYCQENNGESIAPTLADAHAEP